MAALTNKQQNVQVNRKWIVQRTVDQWVLQKRRCGLIARSIIGCPQLNSILDKILVLVLA